MAASSSSFAANYFLFKCGGRRARKATCNYEKTGSVSTTLGSADSLRILSATLPVQVVLTISLAYEDITPPAAPPKNCRSPECATKEMSMLRPWGED